MKKSIPWVCSITENNQGSVSKAHLVAHGFEDESVNTFDKTSAPASDDTLRTLLSTIISDD